MFRYFLALSLVVFFYISPLHSASKKPADISAAEEAIFVARPVIRSIDVKVNELFPGKSGFAKKAANALHAATRKYVIIRELLYKPGQRLDKRLVLESEKNLIGYHGFNIIKTHLKPVKGKNEVDIVVEIQDIWSIYTNVKLEGGGGDMVFNLTMGDKNFLGRNQSLEFSFDRSKFHTHWKQSFKEPWFFGSRLRFEERTALYYDQDGRQIGEGAGLSLIYPLFSRASKWGLHLSFDYDRNRQYRVTGSSIDTIDISGTLYDRIYQKEQLKLDLLVFRSFGYDVKQNVFAGITLDRTGHTPVEDIAIGDLAEFSTKVLPQDKKRNYLKVGYVLDTSRYIRVRNFFYLGRLESYPIGFRFEVMAGFSRRSWWSDTDSYLLSSYLRYSAFFAGNHILSLQLTGSSELFADGSQLNGIFSAKLYYYIRNLPLGFFALRVRADLGENLDVDNVFTMGSSTGLRGYPNDILEGNRRLFVNVEYRFDAIKLGVTRLGFLLFFDIGTAWVNQDEPQTVSNGLVPGTMYPAAGLGLRLTIPSINPNVFRFDFGYNFGNGDTKFENMFSFGYNHVF